MAERAQRAIGHKHARSFVNAIMNCGTDMRDQSGGHVFIHRHSVITILSDDGCAESQLIVNPESRLSRWRGVESRQRIFLAVL